MRRGARVGKSLVALAMLLAPVTEAFADAPDPRIAIVVDDIGYGTETAHRALLLPGALTLGILPHTPAAREAAIGAARHGKEAILHQPMETVVPRSLGPGGLTRTMHRAEFVLALQQSIDTCPECAGVSNHMGSLLTTDVSAMHWIMGELATRNLFFMDSRTTSHSVAAAAARDNHVRLLARDVFLDNDLAPDALNAAFREAIRVARTRGSAILVAHPYPQTFSFLERNLPMLDSLGVRMVHLSELADAHAAMHASMRGSQQAEPSLDPEWAAIRRSRND